MCAIAGLMGTVDLHAFARLEEMLQVQRHRGPDGSGVLHDGEIVIGHRRLAILGLGEAGRQPMTSRDGRWSMVFNGEIFNYRELRSDLERGLPGGWRSQTDTEVLLEAVATWGVEAALRRAAGMFALALWDRHERELTLSRDRLGEKPLVYFHDRRTFAFASEMKALRGFHDGALEPLAVDAYLALGYVPAPLAIFRGCHKLGPGQMLRMKPGGNPRVSRWWDLEPAVEAVESTRDRRENLREQMAGAVRERLRADVPVALSLSGGVDSAVIAAECVRQGASPEAFTVRFAGQSSEVDAARLVARHLGLRHQVLDESGGQGIEHMPRHYDEPFADSSAIPALALARVIAGRFKVVLNGDGGDEVFGGYRHYEHIQIKQTLKAAAAAVGLCDGGQRGGSRVYVESKVTFRAAHRASFLNGYGAGNSLDRLIVRPPPGNALKNAQWIDRQLGLANSLNYKTDIAYGAFGIEGRAPFLDHRLGDWAGTLRPEELVRGREKKILLRAAYAGDLPAEALNRPKCGFGAPIDRWLSGPWRHLAGDLLPCPLLDPELQKGRSGQQLWTLLMFAHWAREWRASW